jgi:type II secretory pathway component PulL
MMFVPSSEDGHREQGLSLTRSVNPAASLWDKAELEHVDHIYPLKFQQKHQHITLDLYILLF